MISAGNVSGDPLVELNDDGEVLAASDDVADVQVDRKLSCRVLVVDDRRDVRFLTQHFLTEFGAKVELAEDGIDALDVVVKSRESRPFDIILLDMQMPRLDGYQTTIRLREMGFTNPIIALTADAMDTDRNRCLESGCDGYLNKPIDAGKLYEIVTRFLDDQEDA